METQPSHPRLSSEAKFVSLLLTARRDPGSRARAGAIQAELVSLLLCGQYLINKGLL